MNRIELDDPRINIETYLMAAEHFNNAAIVAAARHDFRASMRLKALGSVYLVRAISHVERAAPASVEILGVT